MCDVFSREPGISGDTGRICKVGKAQQTIRVRSQLVWVGVHWCGEPGLCAGKVCPLCEAGIPKRVKGWIAIDRPNGTHAALEITTGDLAKFAGACAAAGLEFTVGSSLLVVRTGERQPLSCLGVRFYKGIGEVSQDVLMCDVLRFHGIFATMPDVMAGNYAGLVVNRARELARKVRVPA